MLRERAEGKFFDVVVLVCGESLPEFFEFTHTGTWGITASLMGRDPLSSSNLH
jgi:hypothetical protein